VYVICRIVNFIVLLLMALTSAYECRLLLFLAIKYRLGGACLGLHNLRRIYCAGETYMVGSPLAHV